MHQENEVQQFNRLYKELDDLYHEIALAMGLSDSAFAVLYMVGTLGDGCLQRDICREAYVSKQTVNSSMRNLERQGYLYLETAWKRQTYPSHGQGETVCGGKDPTGG